MQFEAINANFITCLSQTKPPSAIFFEVQFNGNPSDLQNYPDWISYFAAHLRDAIQKGKALAPQCDIILWLPYRIIIWSNYPLCQNWFVQNQEQILDSARAIAVAETVRVVDNWWAFEHICLTPCCPNYPEFLYDGSHTTLLGGTIVAAEALNSLQDIPRDTTAPMLAPLNVRAQATSYRTALIQWNAVSDSADPQSGIAGYEVLRNDGHVSFVLGRSTTFCIDSSIGELSSYSYSVLAINNQLLRGPLSASSGTITTPADQTPPQLLKGYTNGNSHYVTVLFDEPLADLNAVHPGTFNISGYPANVLNSISQPDEKSVIIETDSLIAGKNASVVVSGICDIAHEPNCITVPQTCVVTTGTIDSGAYYKVVDLSLSGPKPSLADMVANDSGFIQQGKTPHCFGSIPCSAPIVGAAIQGLLKIRETGLYHFYMISRSDSSEFSIAAVQTRKLSGLLAQDSLSLNLRQGMVPFVIAAANKSLHDSLTLYLQWSGPGFTRTLIADSLVYHSTGDSQVRFQIHLDSPAPGQILSPGDSIPIAWTQGSSRILLELIFEISFTKGKNWQQLYPSALNSKIGDFIWHVPDSVPGVSFPLDSAIIRTYEYNTSGPYAYSPYFSIGEATGIHSSLHKRNSVIDKVLVRSISKNSVAITFYDLEAGSIRIMDLRGRVAVSAEVKKGANKIQSRLSRGMYLYQILNSYLQTVRSGKITVGVN